MNKHTYEFVICRLDLNQLTLHIRLVLSVKADGFLEIGDLELDVGLGSGTVSISFMNF